MTFVSPDKARFQRALLRAAVWPLLLVTLLAGLLVWQLTQFAKISEWVDHTDRVIAQAGLVQKMLLDMETGARGYLVTRDDRFLEPYAASSRGLDRQFATLETLVSDNKPQQRRVREMEAASVQWRAYAATSIASRRSGAVPSLAVERRGKQLMDAQRGLLSAFSENEAGLRAARVQDERRATASAITFGVGSLLLVAVVMGLYGRRALASLSDVYGRALKSTQDQAETLFFSEQRYATTLGSIGDAVIATDEKGRVTFMNGVAEALTGWSRADAAGKPVDEVFRIMSEATRVRSESPVDRVLATGRIQGLANHTLLIASDGREIPIDDSGAPIRDSNGEITGAVLVFRDISERRAAEKALATSQSRVRRLLDADLIGIVTADRDGRFVEVNDAFLKMTGYTREDFDNGLVRWDRMTPPEWDAVGAETGRHLAERGVAPPYEKEYFRKDGSRVPVSVGAALLDGSDSQLVAYILDLTEQKKAQREQEEASRRVISIFESISEAFFAVDNEWRFTYLNGSGERLIQKTRAEIIGRNFWDVYPELIGSKFQAEYERAFRDNVPVRFTEYYAGLDFWLEVRVYPSPEGLSVYFLDVTEQRGAAEALQRSEDRYRSLVEASTQIVWTTDAEGMVEDMPPWRAFTGQTPEEVRGSGWVDAVHPDDREKAMRVWAAAVAGRTSYESEYRIRRADGEYREMRARGVPVLEADGSIREWVGTCADVTDANAAEASIARRGRQLEILSRATQSMNAVLETSAILRTVTQAAIDVCGAEGGGAGIVEDGHIVFMENSVRGVWNTIPSRYAPNQGVAGRVLTTRRPYVNNDAANDPLLNPASIKQLDMRNLANIPILNRAGEMLGDFAVYNTEGSRPFDEQDVTILQGLSASAATALENARLLAERTQAEEALREADRAKDQFLAVLSHELRNPVASIANAVYLLKQTGTLDARASRARDAIERAAANQARLLEDLLDVSRITQGKITLQRKRLALDESVAAIVRTLRSQAEAKGLRLRFEADDSVFVDVDPTRMDQIISNLIVNSIKYSERGTINVSVRRHGDEAVLRVRDTGIGIAPEMLSAIFNMFSQADSSLAHASGGLGVGLALVRSLVQMHGGRVEAESDGLGHGAVFTMHLPLAMESSASHVPGSEAESAEPGTRDPELRVLIVDDNEDARETLKDILEMDGYAITTAGDGVAAVETAAREKPNVILLDIGLPGMDGYEAARRIRANPGNAGVFLVALTGYGQPSDKDRAREAGFDEHLTKPVNIAALQSLLAHPR